MLTVLEAYAAHGGCVANTLQEWFRVVYYNALATQYAERLSDCARAFFGV